MKAMHDVTVRVNSGTAWDMKKGQRVRITFQSIVDFVVFNRDNLHERFDQARTKANQGKIYLSTGDLLVSKLNAPMIFGFTYGGEFSQRRCAHRPTRGMSVSVPIATELTRDQDFTLVASFWRMPSLRALPTSTVPPVRSNGNAHCLMWSRLHSTIHHLAAGRTESAHVLLKAGDYLFWVRDERVAKPEHVRHASFALLFRSLLPCQRWPLS
jgi:hypothetical protein